MAVADRRWSVEGRATDVSAFISEHGPGEQSGWPSLGQEQDARGSCGSRRQAVVVVLALHDEHPAVGLARDER